ncbi:MAG TPA: metallophosphoesterase [Gemmatimonadaceae bacterium]|nr:metallophosphoesterase [Gemmatimonadaceae bacterium]
MHSIARRIQRHARTRNRYSSGLLLVLAGCDGCSVRYGLERTPPPANAPAEEIALAGAKVMIGAGDIAQCDDTGDEATARLVDSVLKANEAANVETVVFTLGDHAYPEASDRYLRECFSPSWGDPRKGIMKLIRPSVGNHDYQADRAAPTYRYFGERIGPAGKGYYSYDVGDWHVIVLNSELAVEGTGLERREQLEWLRRDLADHRQRCTVSYFHKPLFTSSYREGVREMQAIWRILYDADVDLILSGHDHHYERFLPQNAAGQADSVRGIVQILVGTGGATLRGFRSRFGIRGRDLEGNSAVQIQGHFGVLLLTLGSNGYRSAFLDTEGRIWDRSGRECH